MSAEPPIHLTARHRVALGVPAGALSVPEPMGLYAAALGGAARPALTLYREAIEADDHDQQRRLLWFMADAARRCIAEAK